MSDDDEIDADDSDDSPEEQVESVENAADPKSIKQKRRRVAKRVDEVAAVWRGVLATDAGRRAVWEMLQAGHFDEDRFACGPNGFPNPQATEFERGVQAHARRLYDSLQVLDHHGVYLMRCEHDPKFVNAPRPQVRMDS